jgi:hypothetical protein
VNLVQQWSLGCRQCAGNVASSAVLQNWTFHFFTSVTTALLIPVSDINTACFQINIVSLDRRRSYTTCACVCVYSRTRVKRHRFIRHLAYNVRCSVVPINSSPLTVTLYSSVITTLVYNDTECWVPFVTLQPGSTVYILCVGIKPKAVPLQAWTGPQGSRSLRLPDFQTIGTWTREGWLSALCTGRLYPQGNIPGIHFRYRLSRPQGHSAAGRIMSMKNSNDTIGNCMCTYCVYVYVCVHTVCICMCTYCV